MASTNYEKKYNPTSLLISDDGATWDEWNNLSGTNVQSFIKGELEKSIVDFEYDSDSILWGINSLGEKVAKAEVNVVKPSYHFVDEDKSMSVYLNGSSTAISGTTYNVNANSSLTAQVKFNWNLVQVVNKKENDHTANAVTYRAFLINPTSEDKFASNGLELTGLASYTSAGYKLDITKLLSKSEISSGTVKIRVIVSYSFIDDSNQLQSIECIIDSETKLNVKRIELSYPSDSGILSSKTITFGLSGIVAEDASDFKLQYGVLVNNKAVTGSQAIDTSDVSQVNFDISQVSGAITGDVLLVNLCARVINSDSTLYSDWLTVSALYQSDDTIDGQSGATVAISYVPETVSNCDSANLFNVLTTDKMQGEIVVYVYRSTTKSAIQNILTTSSTSTTYYKSTSMLNNLYKTINISLNGAEASSTESYFSYLEMENITDTNNTIYLAFVIESGSSAEVSTFCSPTSTGSIIAEKVRSITITNPSNASELMHVSEGVIIDYSQIATNKKFNQNGTLKELFSSDNLFDNIDSTDGVTQDGKYMGFKVSPMGTLARDGSSYQAADITLETPSTTVPINLFKNAVKLLNSAGTLLPNTNEFTIEMLIKTYNVNNDDDFILSIGNLRLYADHLRLWSSDLGYSNGSIEYSTPYIASCANFSKDEITHIMITFDKQYKPERYLDTVYSDLYPNFDKSSANGGPENTPCLKIYINGVINRSISIDASQLFDVNGDFSLLIHPQNSNINIYTFRTYSSCLDYDQIQKNRISAFASLDSEKLPFLEANDLLYKSSDYTSDRWALIYEAGLANTISIKKCLNLVDSGYADKTKTYTPKNVMLIVTGAEGPMYYGNKKFTDSVNSEVSQKYHDAAMFVKYAHDSDKDTEYASKYNGKFIGIYLAHENGYDEYYKSQGSSAKRYGGAYNVQFSKFYFIPESKLSLFSLLVDNELYDETAKSIWDESPITNEDGTTTTTYKTNLKLDFNTDEALMEVVEKSGKKSYKQKDTKYPKTYNTLMEKIAKKKYVMPTDTSGAEIKKLVGKVNYASSMQAHKPGACDLFAGCYPSVDNDYMKRRAVREDVFYYFYIKIDDCLERTDGSKPTYRDVTWDDIDYDKVRFFGILTWGSAKMDKDTFGLNGDLDLEYLNIEGADNKNSSTNFKCPWASLQIWNNSTLTERDDPYYSSISGHYSDPESYINQFKGYSSEVNGIKIPDYITGLLIDDETIRYKKPSNLECGTEGADAIEKGPDAWDVAGNAVEETESSHFEFIKWGDEFEDESGVKHTPISPIINSVSSFARMYNYIYTFDFGNLEMLINDEGTAIALTTEKGYSESKKYVMTFLGTITTSKKTYTVNPGDVFRWDQLLETFVPAGLYYNESTGDWETFNLGTEYDEIVNAINEVSTSKYYEMYMAAKTNFEAYTNTNDTDFFDKPTSLLTIRDSKNHYFLGNGVNDVAGLQDLYQRDVYFEQFRGAFADMFKCAIWAYCDVNSFAYHQAAIRFLSGTDNRAKNIYFVLKGNTYKEVEATGKDGNSYTYYEIDDSQKSYQNRFLWTLFADDLDTIFATDNNGQLSKDYNLLEPIYNNDTIGNWGDSRSGLWYNFDLIFEDQIKFHLKRIVDWAIDAGSVGNGTIYNESNNLYKCFLKIQNEEIPAVTYNHMSEIYYDTMQFVYKGGAITTYGATIKGFNDGVFNNNLVSNPESLVHGGCFESEKQFLKKRIAMLASYCSDFTSEDSYSYIKPLGKTSGGDLLKIYMKMRDLSFVQDFYPDILGNTINDTESRTYADPFILLYNPPAYLTALSREGDQYEIDRFELSSGLTSRDSITHTDYYKTVTFTEGVSSVGEFEMNNVSELKYEVPDYEVDGVAVTLEDSEKGINFVPINTDSTKTILYMDKIVKNVEILNVPYSKFTKSIIDLSDCQRLKELDLSYATSTATIANILLPKSNKLSRVTLPSDIKQVTIEYYPNIENYEEIISEEEDERSWFKFDSDDVNLTSITIDLRNSWALDFLEKYAKKGTIENIVFKNIPSSLTITVSLLSLLVDLDKFSWDSTVTLNIAGKVDMTLKGKMAKRWGDIDSSSNSVYCVYDTVYARKIDWTTTSPTIGETGQTVGFNVTDYDGVNANDIKISSNRLQIDYTMTSVSGITVNKTTGEFTIAAGTSIQGKSTTLTVKVYKEDGTNLTASVTVTFGAYIPTAGDIIYTDGSISKTINSNKTAIGFIFWSKLISWLPESAEENGTHTSETYDIRVMAFDSLKSVNKTETSANITSGLPFGPCGSVVSTSMSDSYSYGTMTVEGQKALAQIFTGPEWHANYDKDNDLATQNYVGSLSFNKPTGNRLQIVLSSEVPDSASNDNLYCGYYVTKNAHDFVYRTSNGQSQMVNLIKRYLTQFPYTTLTLSNYDTVYTYLQNTVSPTLGQALFPGYVKTYEWAPTGVDESDEEIGVGKWYVPSAQEYSYLIHEKLLQIDDGTKTGVTHEEDWGKSGTYFYEGQSLRTVHTNLFRTLLTNMNATTLDAYNNNVDIEFLKKTVSCLKSSTPVADSYSSNSNNVYCYESIANYNSTTYGWNGSVSSSYGYGSVNPALSQRAIIYPCCRIIKEISLA